MTPEARAQLHAICAGTGVVVEPGAAAGTASGASTPPPAALRFYAGRPEAAERALVQLLEADPRSIYRKAKCQDQHYQVTLDGLEATCCFLEDRRRAAMQPAAAAAAREQHGTTPSAAEEDEAPSEVARVLSVQLETASCSSSQREVAIGDDVPDVACQ